MTDEERAAEREAERKARNLERLDEMEIFALFMASAMAGGENSVRAASQADKAISEMKKRFT